jgi:hypothetical protein
VHSIIAPSIEAIVQDSEGVQHLIVGLHRENVDSLLRGDLFTLPPGQVPVLRKPEATSLFAETDEELGRRFPPALRPV